MFCSDILKVWEFLCEKSDRGAEAIDLNVYKIKIVPVATLKYEAIQTQY